MSAVFAFEEFVTGIVGSFDGLERASWPEFFTFRIGRRNRQQLFFDNGGKTLACLGGNLFAASNGLV